MKLSIIISYMRDSCALRSPTFMQSVLLKGTPMNKQRFLTEEIDVFCCLNSVVEGCLGWTGGS